MSLNFLIYGIGTTIIYYIGLVFYSKKRTTNGKRNFQRTTDSSHSLIVDTDLADLDLDLTATNLIAPQNSPESNPKEQAQEGSIEDTKRENTKEEIPDFEVPKFEIPQAVFDIKDTPNESVKDEDISNFNELESTNFMLKSFENTFETSMNSAITKTHDIGMSDLLNTLYKSDFPTNSSNPSGEVIFFRSPFFKVNFEKMNMNVVNIGFLKDFVKKSLKGYLRLYS